MKKNFIRKPLCLFAVLLLFGCFYVFRENLATKHLMIARDIYSKKTQGDTFLNYQFADFLSEGNEGVDIKMEKAKIFYEAKKMKLAESEFLDVLEMDKNNFVAYRFLGEINYKNEKFIEAENYYKKSYELNPENELVIKKVKNLVRAGRVFEAEKFLENITGEKSDSIFYYQGLIDFEEENIFSEKFLDVQSDDYKSETDLIKSFLEEKEENDFKSDKYFLLKKADLFNRIGETDFTFLNLGKIEMGRDYRDFFIVLGRAYFLEGKSMRTAMGNHKSASFVTGLPKAS